MDRIPLRQKSRTGAQPHSFCIRAVPDAPYSGRPIGGQRDRTRRYRHIDGGGPEVITRCNSRSRTSMSASENATTIRRPCEFAAHRGRRQIQLLTSSRSTRPARRRGSASHRKLLHDDLTDIVVEADVVHVGGCNTAKSSASRPASDLRRPRSPELSPPPKPSTPDWCGSSAPDRQPRDQPRRSTSTAATGLRPSPRSSTPAAVQSAPTRSAPHT